MRADELETANTRQTAKRASEAKRGCERSARCKGYERRGIKRAAEHIRSLFFCASVNVKAVVAASFLERIDAPVATATLRTGTVSTQLSNSRSSSGGEHSEDDYSSSIQPNVV